MIIGFFFYWVGENIINYIILGGLGDLGLILVKGKVVVICYGGGGGDGEFVLVVSRFFFWLLFRVSGLWVEMDVINVIGWLSL